MNKIDMRPTGLDHRTIIADIETHCPIHCPGCNLCDKRAA